ncbi:MAG: VOC family protein [Enhydrobacter sp.]|nr:VOC family protein [Enhydrobacter sp.]
MKLRQCVFVCKDLEGSAKELCETLGIEIAYRDPGVGKWGLANVVCPTGHDFLEIVSPIQAGTSAGRYIERRKGDGGYMVILQVPDAVKERERITALGIRAVEKKDLAEYKYTHFHPADTAGVLLSIDQTIAPAGVDPALWWPPAAKDWLPHARSNVTNGLAGVEIQAVDPDAAAALWSKILNRPVETDIIRLDDDGEIRFVPIADGRGPGVSAFDVRVVDRDRVLAVARKHHNPGSTHIPASPTQIELCGCRINLV